MREGRSLESMLGGAGPPGQGLGTQPQAGNVQVGSYPLGHLTGAPVRTQLFTVQVIPATAAGKIKQGQVQPATQIVNADPQSRIVIVTAPFVAFAIYVSASSGVSIREGMPLPPGLPYEIVLPGNQELWAVTDAPVFIGLRVQVAPILIGDRERA